MPPADSNRIFHHRDDDGDDDDGIKRIINKVIDCRSPLHRASLISGLAQLELQSPSYQPVRFGKIW